MAFFVPAATGTKTTEGLSWLKQAVTLFEYYLLNVIKALKTLCLLLLTNTGMAQIDTPLVIAHRGASGELPEHTLQAYGRAIEQGADCIEPDLVMSKDGHLIARHDNLLNLSTDVGERLEFLARRSTRIIDGQELTGWFVEDFTLDELRTLRAVERIPAVRPANTEYDGQFELATLADILKLVAEHRRDTGQDICLVPELKHPYYFETIGLPMEQALVAQLHAAGYQGRSAPVIIQSFEVASLRKLRKLTELRLLQLLGSGQPWDIEATGGELSYRDMATDRGLRQIADYADAIGPEKYGYILPRDSGDNLSLFNATDLVERAHALGLLVIPYTLRAENLFLPRNYRDGIDPMALGDAAGELRLFLETGIDGFFTDFPAIGVAERDRFVAQRSSSRQ